MTAEAPEGDGAPAVTSGSEFKRFFSWSARWYDLFLKVVFLGTIDSYRRLASQLSSGTAPGLCLDMASGTGGNAYAFAASNPHLRIVALDISREMLMEARQRRTSQNLEFIQASIEFLPFKGESFDIVTDSCAYHFFHPRRSWPGILRVTKAGGRIIDVDIISRFWDNPVLNPFVRPCIVYQRLKSKVQPLEIPQAEFFRSIGLVGVREVRVRKALAVVQVVTGIRT